METDVQDETLIFVIHAILEKIVLIQLFYGFSWEIAVNRNLYIIDQFLVQN